MCWGIKDGGFVLFRRGREGCLEEGVFVKWDLFFEFLIGLF